MAAHSRIRESQVRDRPSRRAALAGGLATTLIPQCLCAQAPRTVVVGGVTVEDSLPLWYAIAAGLFQRAGLDVQYQQISSGSAAALGLVGGAYNIANTNTLAVTLAHARA